MKEIYDSGLMNGILKKASIPDGVYINVNFASGKSLAERGGLDKAVEFFEREERPVVLYSFEPPFELFQDRRFMRAMGSKKFHFLKCPFSLMEIGDIISLPAQENVALLIASVEIGKQDLLGVLRHNYRHNPQENIERARKELGIEGSDEDIAHVLQDYEAQISSLGQRMGETIIPGTFCDIDGTLLVNGEINQDVLSMLIGYSQNGAVNLWTGNDIKDASRMVGPALERACKRYEARTNLHLRTPILSKQMFAGVRPFRIIDDLTFEELSGQYRFQEPMEYIKIN